MKKATYTTTGRPSSTGFLLQSIQPLAEGKRRVCGVVTHVPRATRAVAVPKFRRILSFLQDMESEAELLTVPTRKVHRLAGDLKNVWSLSVTRNWRITFRIDQDGDEIVDLNCGDYH